MPFYSLPFDTGQVGGTRFPKTDVEESVRQHIRLMLSTMPGRYRFSPVFGSWLNKHHYRLPDKRRGEKKLETELKESLQQNLRLLLQKYEPRLLLQDMEVKVKLPTPGEIAPDQKGGRIIFEIMVIGVINGRDAFHHSESIYLK